MTLAHNSFSPMLKSFNHGWKAHVGRLPVFPNGVQKRNCKKITYGHTAG